MGERGAAFGDALRESQTTVECVIHEAASDDDESEDEIEYVQTREGEAERDWREIERAAASGETPRRRRETRWLSA